MVICPFLGKYLVQDLLGKDRALVAEHMKGEGSMTMHLNHARELHDQIEEWHNNGLPNNFSPTSYSAKVRNSIPYF